MVSDSDSSSISMYIQPRLASAPSYFSVPMSEAYISETLAMADLGTSSRLRPAKSSRRPRFCTIPWLGSRAMAFCQ